MANSSTPTMHRYALLDRSGKNRGTKEAATKREAELLLGLNDYRRLCGFTVVDRGSVEPVYDHVKFTEDYFAVADGRIKAGGPIEVASWKRGDEHTVSVGDCAEGAYFYHSIKIGRAIRCDKYGNVPPSATEEPEPCVPVVPAEPALKFKVGDLVTGMSNIGRMQTGIIDHFSTGSGTAWVMARSASEGNRSGMYCDPKGLTHGVAPKQTQLEEAQDRIDGFVKCHDQMRALLGIADTHEPMADALIRVLRAKDHTIQAHKETNGAIQGALQRVQFDLAEANIAREEARRAIEAKDAIIREQAKNSSKVTLKMDTGEDLELYMDHRFDDRVYIRSNGDEGHILGIHKDGTFNVYRECLAPGIKTGMAGQIVEGNNGYVEPKAASESKAFPGKPLLDLRVYQDKDGLIKIDPFRLDGIPDRGDKARAALLLQDVARQFTESCYITK